MFYRDHPKTTNNQHITTYTHINIQLIFFLLILLMLIFLNGIIPYYQFKIAKQICHSYKELQHNKLNNNGTILFCKNSCLPTAKVLILLFPVQQLYLLQ